MNFFYEYDEDEEDDNDWISFVDDESDEEAFSDSEFDFTKITRTSNPSTNTCVQLYKSKSDSCLYKQYTYLPHQTTPRHHKFTRIKSKEHCERMFGISKWSVFRLVVTSALLMLGAIRQKQKQKK